MPYKSLEITNTSNSISVQQKTSQFYKGFSTLDATTNNTKLYDIELIKQNILNHFNTKKGERVMNPKFGSVIWDLLMEPLTEQIKELIIKDINEICNFDQRVRPLQIDVNEYESGYILELTLLVLDTDQTDSLRLAFDQKVGLVLR
jgi:phage baseplate assembly protein W